jgi:ABC-2 type transport system ATP-binding protein
MTGTRANPIGRTLVRFDGATKWYGPVVALMDVSFDVGQEIVGLVGKNGVGKSTLMKLAAGLLSPSQGWVLVDGLPATSEDAKARVGFSPDLERLPESLSGMVFVAWMLRFHGLSLRAARERAAEVLEGLGMREHMLRPIRGYSKGMRQRVRLAQALSHRPSVVLLDEPMTGLDPFARAELASLIRGLPKSGVGVLVSSHVLHELEAIADRIVLVHQGRLLADGPVAELRGRLPAIPHRVKIVAARPRDFAVHVMSWPQVLSVAVQDEAVEVVVTGEAGFYTALTDLGVSWSGGVTEVVPLGDDLASVFGHLVG